MVQCDMVVYNYSMVWWGEVQCGVVRCGRVVWCGVAALQNTWKQTVNKEGYEMASNNLHELCQAFNLDDQVKVTQMSARTELRMTAYTFI